MVKTVLIGLGHIGARHAAIVESRSDMELSAIVDRDPALRQNNWSASGVPFFERFDDFIHSGIKCELAIIATPNGHHSEHAVRSIQAGMDVVIEKPMALSKDQCEKIIFESLKESKRVFVVKQNRYSPPSRWLKDLVERKVLGEIYQVQVNCLWNRDKAYYDQREWRGTLDLDGGPLFTQFSHFVDLLFWLFGDIRDVKSFFSNNNHKGFTEFEDSGVITFKLLKSALGSFNFSTSAFSNNMESSITILAEKGALKVGGQYMNTIEYCSVEGVEKPILEESNPPNTYGQYTGSAANHHYVYENVMNTLTGKESVSTNAIEGMKVVEMIETMYGSGNRKKVIKSLKTK